MQDSLIVVASQAAQQVRNGGAGDIPREFPAIDKNLHGQNRVNLEGMSGEAERSPLGIDCRQAIT